MTLEADRHLSASALGGAMRDAPARLSNLIASISAGWRPIGSWLARTPVARFLSANLLRRILASNLFGLLLLLGGILYLGQYHAWLIEAKRDALKIQGEIIAAAIAGDVRLQNGQLALNPAKLPEPLDREAAQSAPLPFRDDAFVALQLSISPERVTPVVRKLTQPTNTRARIYGRDGALIVDTAMFPTRGGVGRAEDAADGPLKTQNFWTRLHRWLIDKQMPVYREIGTANGKAYDEVRAALEGTTTAMMLLNDKGEQIVSVAVPIQKAHTVQGALLLSSPPGEIDKIIWEERSIVLMLAIVALTATIVSSLLLARTVSVPMRRLAAAARHSTHTIAARRELPDYPDRTDEVGQMAGAFADMTGALYRRIEASEKFAADVAHELKNPLTAARSTAESLGYARDDEERQHLVAQIQGELKRLNRLISDVSNASRLDAELARQEMAPVQMTNVLSGVVSIFRDVLGEDERSILLVMEPVAYESSYLIVGNDGRIGQVLTNLVDNALSFSPEAGTVTVRARVNPAHVEVMIDDEGPGIPEDRLDMIFERFYSDRPATDAQRGKNSGLGLSISREIVRAHGGQIFAENLVTHDGEGQRTVLGARFTVRFPLNGSGPRSTSGLAGRRG